LLIGAHVSTGGGWSAIERAEDLRCESIRSSTRAPGWRPTLSDDDFAAFREAIGASKVEVVAIRRLPDQPDQGPGDAQEVPDSLTHALRVGDGIGAMGVVVHPGALKDDTRTNARKRAVKLIKEALAEPDHCPIFYENTAGSPQLLGRDFDETAELIDKTGGPKRLGLCIDSCHLWATGYDLGPPEGVRPGRRDRRQGRPRSSSSSTSTTRATRAARTVTATLRSPTAR
jgi:deoxyribonuclease-4